MKRLALLLGLIVACSDASGPSAFDVQTTLRRQLGNGPPCGWWWSAVSNDSGAPDARSVTYSVRIGPATRVGVFTGYTVVAVPELGFVLSAGTYDYNWSIEAGEFRKTNGSGSATCP